MKNTIKNLVSGLAIGLLCSVTLGYLMFPFMIFNIKHLVLQCKNHSIGFNTPISKEYTMLLIGVSFSLILNIGIWYSTIKYILEYTA